MGSQTQPCPRRHMRARHARSDHGVDWEYSRLREPAAISPVRSVLRRWQTLQGWRLRVKPRAHSSSPSRNIRVSTDADVPGSPYGGGRSDHAGTGDTCDACWLRWSHCSQRVPSFCSSWRVWEHGSSPTRPNGVSVRPMRSVPVTPSRYFTWRGWSRAAGRAHLAGTHRGVHLNGNWDVWVFVVRHGLRHEHDQTVRIRSLVSWQPGWWETYSVRQGTDPEIGRLVGCARFQRRGGVESLE
jgi:hypothetical protein